MTKLNLAKIKREKPISRLMNFGILNIDKPADWTSFDVVNYIRRMLNLPKCGHFGTLDPNVTGVLPICLGDACKIQEYFMHRDKVYIGKMKLHQKTTRKKLEEEMKKFLGVINQLPPRISRVKRQVRQREIMEFKLLDYDSEKKEANFIAEVEAGTYIRKLIDDLGKNINGAQMIELRRTRAGMFSDKDREFVKLEELKKAVEDWRAGNETALRRLIIPAEILNELIPSVEVNEESLIKLRNGSPLFENMIIKTNLKENLKIIEKGESFIITCNDRIIEIAKKTEQFQNKEILAKPEVVLK
ncbi:MAG: RNA-guided pseudouridylation complex pseudouridine synthase subunit Cbf5 [Nanoarchaeota archaeon]|mgnify:CR=1 FL=1